MGKILALEDNLSKIEQARRNGFDLDVTVGQIDATKREIDSLYAMEVSVPKSVEAMRRIAVADAACVAASNAVIVSVREAIRKTYEELYKDED